jgi:hypothetical protein
MAADSSKPIFPSLPDEPYHPKNFTFPKRSFGKSKPVLYSAQRANGQESKMLFNLQPRYEVGCFEGKISCGF